MLTFDTIEANAERMVKYADLAELKLEEADYAPSNQEKELLIQEAQVYATLFAGAASLVLRDGVTYKITELGMELRNGSAF